MNGGGFYAVSAQRSTAVTHSVTGNFTSPDEINLILSKGTRLEVHTLREDGLQGVLDVPIYGRISALKLFRPLGQEKDSLFVLTEKYKFCVLEYNKETGELITKANGDATDRVGRPAEAGQIALVDPHSLLFAFHLIDGQLKIIPIGSGGALQEAFNVRLEELKVIDVAFLYECPAPTIAVLYEDTKEQRHIKTYEIKIREKELIDGPWVQHNLDPGSSLIIPVRQTNGVVVVGEEAVVFISADRPASIGIPPTMVKAYGEVGEDGSRYLLGDYLGNLFLLLAIKQDQTITSLKLEPLGRTSQASTLTYLDSGVVFIGSSAGDSQLIKLHSTPQGPPEQNNFVEVLDSVTNLGPIVDFSVVDLERQGQGQVVTCSGTGVDGSLRIVRNGIGVIEQATVELPGIKGLWSLRKTYMDVNDTYLVLTFVGETRVLGLNQDDELDEADIPGFDSNAQTLWCGNMVDDQFLQVTTSSVRLVDCNTNQLVGEWRPPAGKNIVVAAGSPSQVIVATGGGHVVYLEVGDHSLTEKTHHEMGAEVSCLDITPIGENTDRAEIAVVGTWSIELQVLSLPSLSVVTTDALGGDVMPRSVLCASFEGVPYLLCGLGDGHLVNYRFEGSGLTGRKKIGLGTKPITLRTFVSRGTSYVFAASDRPTIIYSSNKKLLYSNLNENEVNFMTSFNTTSFPDSLAIAKEESMTIGSIDEIQKLHIRTVPLHEQPRRFAFQDESKTFGVLTTQANMGAAGEAPPDSVRLMDSLTFEQLTAYPLGKYEMACSITSALLADDQTAYYIVGTAFVLPEEMEPTKGRILLFEAKDSKLSLVSEKETRGAVYNVMLFQGRLLAGINGRIQLYKWEQQEDGSRQLVPECSHAGHILALFLDTRGDFVLVGDLMKSMQLLMFKPDEPAFEVRAKDFNPSWMSAATMLDDDTYLGAENNFNLFVVRKNSDAATDEERSRLEVVAQYHLGEFVNRFRHGSLVMKLPDSELSTIPTLLYGTINGVIGVIATLPSSLFQMLSRLQAAMRKVVQGVGGLSHSEWRAFSTPFAAPVPDKGFVDGDLIEQFLDLKRESMEAVVSQMGEGATVENVIRTVEELARLH